MKGDILTAPRWVSAPYYECVEAINNDGFEIVE